jgi:hypothetical protein
MRKPFKLTIAQALVASMAVVEPETDRLGRRLRRGSTPNKYEPHQGAREKARRVRQMSVKDVTKPDPGHGAS